MGIAWLLRNRERRAQRAPARTCALRREWRLAFRQDHCARLSTIRPGNLKTGSAIALSTTGKDNEVSGFIIVSAELIGSSPVESPRFCTGAKSDIDVILLKSRIVKPTRGAQGQACHLTFLDDCHRSNAVRDLWQTSSTSGIAPVWLRHTGSIDGRTDASWEPRDRHWRHQTRLDTRPLRSVTLCARSPHRLDLPTRDQISCRQPAPSWRRALQQPFQDRVRG